MQFIPPKWRIMGVAAQEHFRVFSAIITKRFIEYEFVYWAGVEHFLRRRLTRFALVMNALVSETNALKTRVQISDPLSPHSTTYVTIRYF